MTTRRAFDDRRWSKTGAALAGSAIRQMGILAAGRPDIISFAPGYPDPELFAWDDYRALADEVLRASHPDTLQYSPTRGLAALHDVLVGWLGARGIACRHDEVLVTSGSQQGIDLLTRVLVDPGDIVLVELPAYTGAIAAFRNRQADLRGIRQDEEGLDVEHLDATLLALHGEGRTPKFLYLIPTFQNPSGRLMSPARRRALADLAARHDLLIVEDDPYGDLAFDPSPTGESVRPIAADAGDAPVVYLQSTSKTLAPGFRTAWMVGPRELLDRAETAKQSTDLCSSGLDQRIVCEALARGLYDRDLPRLRERYAARCQVMLGALQRHAPASWRWEEPGGGFFVWVEDAIPEAGNDDQCVRQAIEAGVVYVPGRPFYVDGRSSRAMRLAFSAAPVDRIEDGVRRLAAVMASPAAVR